MISTTIGKKNRIILNLVNLEHDKPLVEEIYIEVGIERHFQLAATVELF